MKKGLITIALLLVVVIATVSVRTNSVFEERQPVVNKDDLNGIVQKTQSISEAAATRLSQSIQIKTISYDDRQKFDTGEFKRFHQLLEDSYPTIHQVAKKTVINGYSLVYHVKGTDSSLKPALFLNHMDVVPVDPNTLDKWTHGPYSGDIKNGVVWGRGALDDKGGVMALMEGLELYLQDNNKPKRDIYLAFGHDEEVGGSEGAGKIAKYFADNKIQFEFALDEGGAVMDGILDGYNRPVAMVGIAEKGYVNVHLTVKGEGGHSSQPPAQTAVGILSQAIANVEQNQFPASMDFLGITFEHIGNHGSWPIRMVMSNLWLFGFVVEEEFLADPEMAASLRTTIAPTMLQGSPKSNALAQAAKGVINIRIMPGETYDTVKQHIETAINDPRVEVTLSAQSNPPPISSDESEAYKLLADTIVQTDDNALVAPYMVQAATDSKYYPPVSDNVYRFLMLRLNKENFKQMHGVNEQIAVEDYTKLIEFYYRMIHGAGKM